VPEILVVTSDFHGERARYIFEREFADSGVRLDFCVTDTDEEVCELDLEALRKHERRALARLKRMDSRPI
jgi:hypothetical protein